MLCIGRREIASATPIDPLSNDVMHDVIDLGVVAKGVRRSAYVVMVMSAVLLAGCAFVSTTSLDLSASFG